MSQNVVSQRRVLSIVLAGGEGRRLYPLTDLRAKPAVPFGGHYRIIDFALSNLVNGGFRRIVVLTQYKSHSLDVHLSRTWRMSNLLGNYVTSVPAQMRQGPRWFLGSADAIFQNLNLFRDEHPEYVFVFGADHIYRMDPSQMLSQHIESGAGITVAAIPVPLEEATEFGVIERGEGTRIDAFVEKPDHPKHIPGDDTLAYVSMGNYVFTASALIDLVTADAERDDSAHDLGANIVTSAVEQGIAHVYDFAENVIPGSTERDHGYWRDVGSIASYFDAQMDLVHPEPVFNLYNSDWPIFTDVRPYPPTKLVASLEHGAPSVAHAILANGVVVTGAHIERAVIHPRVRVEKGAELSDAVVFDQCRIGEGAVVRRTILDKNVDVRPGAEVGVDLEKDRKRGFTVTDEDLVVVPKNAVVE
ncbi:MAG: glucose-1-phosphate adenylyltransferase [Actinomycetota bacterium]|nr:glucose-1-phosphate adenylyltransferase [Actinomycetota bacterium]